MQFVPTDKLITDALRYMRVPPEGRNDELVRTVVEAFGRLEGYITPRCVWGRFHVVHFDGGFEIEGAYIYSNDIARLTARSDECIMLAATLGHETDRQITIAQNRNMLDGIALDACASVRIDAFIDQFIRSEIVPGLREGERMTSRFSPGYGDLKMNVTEDIIAILNATKRIGLSVTGSMMMSPIKSVTAITGLFSKQEN
ncbi:MAG: methionine synthase [Synergistaceae bacterium]|nr:methionine synthase [Synergistaceae bacterium]MBQ9574899.1 methionine synthase [Synergistaceae bacterium]